MVLISLLISCLQGEPYTDSTEVASSFFDSGIVDTANDPVVATTGSWKVTNSNLVSDECSIANFQDVNKMIPSEFKIEESYLTFFRTDTTNCPVDTSGGFICDSISLEETTLGGTAAMQIETTMKGKLRSSSEMDLGFDIIIKSCEGAGCIAIELALTFPCPMILNATGTL